MLRVLCVNAFELEYRYKTPDGKLSTYVRTILIVEESGRDISSNVPLFTNGMPALLYRSQQVAGKEQIVELALYGKSTPAEKWNVNRGEAIIAYFFKPFSIAPLFNLESRELKSEPIELGLWNAHKTNALRLQLAEAKTIGQKVATLNHLILVQLDQQANVCELVRKATDIMMNDVGADALTSLRKELKINERTLQRIFKKYVGVTPNHFRRICQFQLSFTKVRGGRFEHLTDVAFDSGFADQSHFIRTFKEFTQTRPRDYLKTGLKQKKS